MPTVPSGKLELPAGLMTRAGLMFSVYVWVAVSPMLSVTWTVMLNSSSTVQNHISIQFGELWHPMWAWHHETDSTLGRRTDLPDRRRQGHARCLKRPATCSLRLAP